jgi:signal transduction histidine kinase
VRLDYGDDRLTITVTNPMTGAVPGEGFGLVGMCERAHSAGGRFEAGPRPEGAFTVTTELPIRP